MRRLRLVLMAALVTAMVAGFAAGRAGEPAFAQNAAQTSVVATLYDTWNRGGGTFIIPFKPISGLQVRTDIPDMRSVCCDNFSTPLNYNDRARAITVSAPTAVAVYSDINFGGTCETYFGPGLKFLATRTIGENVISSIHVNATCLGPTTGKPVVTDIKVVTSPGTDAVPSCPSGYSRISQDLNQGLETPGQTAAHGGDHVYVCVQYGPANATSGVTAAKIIGPFDCVGSHCTDTSFNSPDQTCPSPATRLTTDLNSHVVDFGAVYLCITKATGAGQTYLRDITFRAYPPAQGPDVQGCQSSLGVPSGVLQPELGDANASGSNLIAALVFTPPSIYLCASVFDGPDAAQTFGPTTPPTLTTRAVNIASNCRFVCPPPSIVHAGDTVTVNGAVHVQWDCTADNDSSNNHSVPSVIVRNSRPWNITGICYDDWGNIAMATFSFIRAVP